MKKKFLILSSENNPKTQGGVQTFCRVLSSMFSDISIIVARKNEKGNIYNVENLIEIPISNIFIKILNKLFNYKIEDFFYKRIIKRIKPDIIILNSPQKVHLLKNVRTQNILVQHTTFDRYMVSKYYFNSNEQLIELTKKMVNKFVLLSPYDKDSFIKGLNLNSEQAVYIRHSCKILLKDEPSKKIKKLVMITRISNKYKRIDLAIKAMSKLSDYTLEIWGEGHDRKELEKLIQRKNLGNVKFMGSTSKVAQVLDSAGIYVITSDFEGYPMSGVEALRRGLPIIVRNTFDSARDLVSNNGVLLDKEWNEEKFILGIKNIEQNYEKYSQNSLILGKRYSIDLIRKDWQNLFEELCLDRMEKQQ